MFSATYILVQTFHICHTNHALFSFLHCFFSLNIFYATGMRFTTKRLRHIARQVQSLTQSSKSINNRKLSRLIIEHNQVHHDLIRINEFFRNFVGFNVISSFGLSVTMSFIVLLDTDWRLFKSLTSQ